MKSDDLTRQTLEPGKIIPLKNIYFEFDKDELMPRSFVELNKLLKIMRDNPKLSIRIIGPHRCAGQRCLQPGAVPRRAQAVVNFLSESKIGKNRRLSHRGEGERQPIATNDTDEGRAENRRVEFVVIRN